MLTLLWAAFATTVAVLGLMVREEVADRRREAAFRQRWLIH